MDVEFLPTRFKNSWFWMINILKRKKMQWWAQVSQFSKNRFLLMKLCFTEYLLLMNFYNNINFLSLYTSKVTPNFCLLEIKYSSDPKRNSLNVFTLSSKIVSNFFQAVIMSIFNKQKNPPWICPLYHLLKFIYCEKAAKFEKKLSHFFEIT